MDTGLLIGLIVLLGGSYLLITKKKKQETYLTHPITKGSIKGSKRTIAYKVKALFLDNFSPNNLRIFSESQPNITQKPTINKVK